MGTQSRVDMAEPRKEVKMWATPEQIKTSFEFLGATGMSIVEYLGTTRVILDNDPVLVAAFGQEAVEEYERQLKAARPR